MYVNEIAYWVEGMPFDMFNEVLRSTGHKALPPIVRPKTTKRIVSSDIPVIGDSGLKILDNVGVYLMGGFEGCIGCKECEKECPERALQVLEGGPQKFTIKIATEHCLGTACKNCESVCPQKVYRFSDLKVTQRD
jgi:ferredoxin